MPRLTVTFWDGTTKPAATRDEAVQIIIRGLDAWMEKGDKLIWYLLPGDIAPPSRAYVGNKYGEETDAWATISGEDKVKQQLPSFQDCIKILEGAKENRKKCCERLIKLKVLKKDAWESGEFDKVCSDCEGCGKEVPE